MVGCQFPSGSVSDLSISPQETDRDISIASQPPMGHARPSACQLASAQDRICKKGEKLARTGPKRYDEPAGAMEFYLQQRLAPGRNLLPLERLQAARQQIQAREAAAQALRGAGPFPGDVTNWTKIGPGNIGGRTRGFVIHPTNPNVLFAAGVAGGIWKSTDAGATWTALDDLLLNIAVNSLAIDPVNPDVLYAGTGEGFFNSDAVRGLGIFKTTDGGTTWAQLAGTVDGSVPFGAFFRVNDLVISPNDHNRLYAATRYGVWRSTDAGATWSVVLANPFFTGGPVLSNGSSVGCTDLAVRADTNPDVLFAAFGSFGPDGLFRSTDGGTTWSQLGTAADLVVPNQGRMAIAIAPSDNDTVYVCMADNADTGNPTGTLVDVFRSTDGGDTWSPRVDFGSLTGPWLLSNLVFATGCAGTSNFAQGWYDNIIAVDPLDPDIVWVGGVDLFRSDDGGVNWGIASYWFFSPGDVNYAHADQHNIVFHPGYDGAANQIMYATNDGGLFRTANARAATSQEDCPFARGIGPLPAIVWEDLNNGYGVTQFYHGDSARDRDAFGGGCQDNGTLLVESVATPEGWFEIVGGDGGYFAIDPTNSLVLYAETQRFPRMQKSVDGGASFFDATAGINDADGLFITPFAMDPSNSNVLWTGGSRPWRTTDGAANWTLAAPGDPGDPGDDPFPSAGRLSAVAVAPTNSNVVYLGFENGVVARSTNALASPPNWTEFTDANGLPFGFISSLAVSPVDADTAYCTSSTFDVSHVLKTVNGGVAWTSIDGPAAAGVPDIPVHWVAIRPCNPQQLYAGTELGVFVSDDDGVNWTPVNAGLAHTVVETLDFQDDNTLIAFTHGRGAFRAELFDADGDGFGDGCDNCATRANADQRDCDANLVGDVCEIDVGVFVAVLLGQDGDPAHQCVHDMDGNGMNNGADIPGFIAVFLE